MANTTPQDISGSDPSIERQIQRQTSTLLSTGGVSAPPTINTGSTTSNRSGNIRSIAPVVSGSETVFPQSTAQTSGNSVTITSSINNDSGDITTVYTSASRINVNPVNQTINQYTSIDSGVSSVVAGDNITITSTAGNGTGTVTISANASALSYGDSNVVSLLENFGSNTISTTGNVSAGNFAGNGSGLTSIQGNSVSGQVSFAAVANSVAAGNVSGLGNISIINLDGNVSNVLRGDGTFGSSGSNGSYGNSDVVSLLAAFGSNTITTTGLITGNGGGLSNIPYANITGTPVLGNIATINLDGNASNVLRGNGSFGPESNGVVGNKLTANLDANGFFISNAANITANYFVGTATNIEVEAVNNNFSYHVVLTTGAGDSTLHNDIDDSFQYNPQDGILTVSRVDTEFLSVTNSVISNLVPFDSLPLNLGSNTNRWNDIYLSNSTIYLGDATISANGNSIVVDSIIVGNNPPISNLGNISTINLNGNANNVLRGDGTWGVDANSSYGDSNVVTLLSSFGSNTMVTTGNISAGNIIGNGQALTGINGSNVTGEVSYAAVANAVAGSNVTGEVSFAVIANSVAIANVSGIVLDQNEIYVSKNGNDTTGNGTIINPYLTISKAVSVVGDGQVIIVGTGSYYEDVNIANKFAVTISSDTTGGRQAFTPAIYGNLTVSGNSTSISVKGIGIRDTITHSSNGTFYLTGFQLGTGNVTGSLAKTGSGTLSLLDSSMAMVSGGNITPVTISGSGSVTFSNVAIGLLNVSNSSATVTMLNNSTTLQANVSSGSLNVFDSILYTPANSGFNAINATGGTLNIRNSIAINPNLTTARINAAIPTIVAYDDFYFDRANSNVGIIANVVLDFQSLRLSNVITANGFSGNGSGLSNLTLANITGIGNIANINLTGSNSNVLYGNGVFAPVTGGAGAVISNGNSYANVTASNGNVVIGVNNIMTWTFDTTGNLVLAGGNSVIFSTANSSLDPLNPNVSTMTLTPDSNYNSQVLVLDPTAPGHIHLRAHAFSNIDDPAANIFLGGEATSFEITQGANNDARIHSGSNTWYFENNGNLVTPGLTGTYIKSAPGGYMGLAAMNDGGDQPAQLVSINSNLGLGTTAISAYANEALIQTNIAGGNIQTWVFDNDGAITFPNSTLKVPNENEFNITTTYGNDSSYAEFNPAGPVSTIGAFKASENKNIFVETRWMPANTSYAAIGVAGKIWYFDEAGHLTLPGNTFNINYANGTQASAPLVDVLNTNGLSTVYYPTFVEDRANGQIVRADVDLSYTTDTNTLTVGNVGVTGNISAKTLITTPILLANLTATPGARSFISDSNLVATGNWGAIVSGGGSNTVPVWSDGTNWYIG